MVALVRAALVAALLAPGMAFAQLAECAGLGSSSDSFKVVLDELSVPTPAAPAGVATGLENLKELLAFSLAMQLQEIQKEVDLKSFRPSIGLGVVNCANRKPSIGGTEFTPARVESLNDQRVIVELWGTLLGASGNNDGAPRAMIGYIIPPVLHYQPGSAISGRYLIQYPRGTATAAEALQKLPEASGFALLGLAVKARKALKYDLAVWAFVRSAASIAAAIKLTIHAPEAPAGDPELVKLRNNVLLAACTTREAARADPQYRGSLTLEARETCAVAP